MLKLNIGLNKSNTLLFFILISCINTTQSKPERPWNENILEKEPLAATNARKGEPEKQFRNDYKYFPNFGLFMKLHEKKKTWFEAKGMCQSEGTLLAVIKTKAEADEILKTYQQSIHKTGDMWLGLQDILTESEFETISGESINSVYGEWDTYEPNNAGGIEDCVVIQSNGRLNDVSCNKTYAFICRKDADLLEVNADCDNFDLDYRRTTIENQCIKFHKTAKTWEEAYRNCKGEQAQLAVINSENEAAIYISEFQKYPKEKLHGNFNKDMIYLGFHDKFSIFEFDTVNGKTLAKSGYEEWADGEPNFTNSENCGGMFRNGKLMDVACSEKAMFICEKTLFNKTKEIPIY